jgi:hypothetical protein
VDLVAARGELDAELGGDDAGAAVGGITGDADLHKASCLVSLAEIFERYSMDDIR